MVGAFDGERIALHEAVRFPNIPVRVLDSLHWDVLRLFDDIKRGLASIVSANGGEVASIGLDTWGVDFALLGRDDGLLGNPFHYRDARTEDIMPEVFRRVPRERIFAQTGIQFMPINTLYQLYAMKIRDAPAFTSAQTLLMIPDLFNFWLTGQKACEYTIATTTQCYDPRARAWAWSLLESLELPSAILPAIIAPGTMLGPLHKTVSDEVGLRAQVIAPACHDTASAVAAVPAVGEEVAWISSGTWSVLGASVSAPVIDADSLTYNFTNEGGVGGTIRLCKNVMGLWLVQEFRRAWARRGAAPTYESLMEMARCAPALRSLIDPDDEAFLRPGDMPARIVEFCRRTAQPIPEDNGAFVRCALESLALKYRFQLERLEALLGKTFSAVHIVGGGVRNSLLCQFTANATGKRVSAGPVEATALGNVLMQALALGHIASPAEGRQLVARSVATQVYEPSDRAAWDEAYARFVRSIISH